MTTDKMTPTTPSPISDQAAGEPVGEASSMPGTEGFTMAAFKASDVPVGTKLYLRSTAPTTGSAPETDEPLKCDFCGVETPDPWHTSDLTRKHLHQCDSCHAASPAASVLASISDTQILEAFEAAGVQWQSVRTLANDHEYMTRGSQSAKNLIAGVRALLAASMGGDKS